MIFNPHIVYSLVTISTVCFILMTVSYSRIMIRFYGPFYHGGVSMIHVIRTSNLHISPLEACIHFHLLCVIPWKYDVVISTVFVTGYIQCDTRLFYHYYVWASQFWQWITAICYHTKRVRQIDKHGVIATCKAYYHCHPMQSMSQICRVHLMCVCKEYVIIEICKEFYKLIIKWCRE